MSTFDSTKTRLSDLLQQIADGRLQLPDFQRGWVWDDAHIQSLLVSVARAFPIGAVMLLETGGEVRFQERPVEGVKLKASRKAEELILDGQQRLTSLTQVLKLKEPVETRDAKKRTVKLHYYFDIAKALEGPEMLEEAVFAVTEDKKKWGPGKHNMVLDLSDVDREVEAFCFPCDQILDSSDWEYALMQRDRERFKVFMDFRKEVLDPFRNYMLPVIKLGKATSKEAVCLVFEKVNTGGVSLSVFELVTATWAAEEFNLRDDWFGVKQGAGREGGRRARLARRAMLGELKETDFLQGVSLLHSLEQRRRDVQQGVARPSAVTAKREHILRMPKSAYVDWADALERGFERAVAFLRAEGFHQQKFLPYRSQLVPLAAVLTHLGERWREPVVRGKLARWYWSGVFGELYGSASETRIALDMEQLLAWIDEGGAEPDTVKTATFHRGRLDRLRTRTSAAYRGLYVLLQREGASDFFWSSKIVELDRDEVGVDIHHIFPKKWCTDRKIPRATYNAIVNKTPISYRANRMIGGKAPSEYLAQLQAEAKRSAAQMDAVLETHQIDAALLRADAFEAFYNARREALLRLIEAAMGKTTEATDEPVGDDGDVDDDMD